MQRNLTGGEIELLKVIYGSTINYDLVLVESRSPDSILGSATSYGNLITIPANSYFDDYSNISSGTTEYKAAMQGLFIHEVCHTFEEQALGIDVRLQGTLLGLKFLFNYEKAYEYSANHYWGSMNIEQKCAVIEDRYRVENGLNPRYNMTWKASNDDADKSKSLYDAMLKPFDGYVAGKSSQASPDGTEINSFTSTLKTTLATTNTTPDDPTNFNGQLAGNATYSLYGLGNVNTATGNTSYANNLLADYLRSGAQDLTTEILGSQFAENFRANPGLAESLVWAPEVKAVAMNLLATGVQTAIPTDPLGRVIAN